MMDTERKQSKKRFARGLALYALILAVILLLGLIFFYFYIYAYENSRATSALDRYRESLDESFLQEQEADFLSTLNDRVQPREESLAQLVQALQEARFAKVRNESTDAQLVYLLRSGEAVLGRLVLQPSDRKTLGFTPWEVRESELNLEPLCQEVSVAVPDDYQVVCNGYTLTDADVTDDHVPYPILESFYDDFPALPCLLQYSTGRYVGNLETVILDPSGNSYAPDELDPLEFSDNCSAAEEAQIRDFIEEYIPRYVTYLSGANGAHYPNLYAVLAWTVPGSELYSRLYQALGGMGWASSQGDIIQSITVNDMMNTSAGYYACDVTYLVETYGQNGALTTTTNNARILLTPTDDGLRAVAQVSY